jgi:predicted enzyme related to lactoylglutathione lyase
MPAAVRHVAINAEDTARARAFYETVFGWKFQPWGPPGFYNTRDPGVIAAVQGRRRIENHEMPGMEITFGVDDLDATIAAIEANGGTVLMRPYHIETVGRLIFFRDTEGNIAGAMQYETPQ